MRAFIRKDILDRPGGGYPWQVPIGRFLEKPLAFDASRQQELDRAPALLARIRDVASGSAHWVEHPYHKNLEFVSDLNAFAMRKKDTGEVIAGYHRRLVVAPEHQGQGFGAEAQFLRLLLGGNKAVFAMSRTGLEATRAAHRLHVERALIEGIHVPDLVLADYEIQRDRLKLKEPYDPDEAMFRYERDKLGIHPKKDRPAEASAEPF